MNLQLVGLRAENDLSHSDKMLALLRSPSGRRTNVLIPRKVYKSFEECRQEVMAALKAEGKDGGVENIDEPDDNASDMPWNHCAPSERPFGQTGRTISQGAGNHVQTATFDADRETGMSRHVSNQEYLRRLNLDPEVTFDMTPSGQIEANNRRIEQLRRESARRSVELLEETTEAALRPYKDRLLSLTPLGRACLGR